jgi:hypothetical protein
LRCIERTAAELHQKVHPAAPFRSAQRRSTVHLRSTMSAPVHACSQWCVSPALRILVGSNK